MKNNSFLGDHFQTWSVGVGWSTRIVFFISAIMAGPLGACPLDLPTTSLSIKGNDMVVELAATAQARACGLSHRSALGDNRGMLFVYPDSGRRTFWMKDTLIPLSIAFLDEDGVIINIEIMSPDQTDERYGSRKPAVYALEVNQGWFREHGIKAGDRVEMQQAFNFEAH